MWPVGACPSPPSLRLAAVTSRLWREGRRHPSTSLPRRLARTRGQASRSAGRRPQRGAVLLLSASPTHGEPGPARGRGAPGPSRQAPLLQVEYSRTGMGTGPERQTRAEGRRPRTKAVVAPRNVAGDAPPWNCAGSGGGAEPKDRPRRRGVGGWVLPEALSGCQKGLREVGSPPPGSAGAPE